MTAGVSSDVTGAAAAVGGVLQVVRAARRPAHRNRLERLRDDGFRAPGVTVVGTRQWAPFITGGRAAG
jgi:hypothetical protein